MSIIQGVAAGGGIDTGDPITRGLRFNSADSAYLNRTITGTYTSDKKFKLFLLVKRTKLGTTQYVIAQAASGAGTNPRFEFTSSDTIYFSMGGSVAADITTAAVFRDVSAWYIIEIDVDTTLATAADRIICKVNGVRQTLSASNNPPLNHVTDFMRNAACTIGQGFSTGYCDFLLAGIGYVDGSLPTITRTSADTGACVWAGTSTVTWGNKGFFLNFYDNSGTTSTTLGKDTSGNSNNWTPNNFSVTAGVGNDSLTDTPTNNYPTWNSLDNDGGVTLANGNLDATWGSASDRLIRATVPVPRTGKFYAELTVGNTTSAAVALGFGLCTQTASTSSSGYSGSGLYGYYASNQSNINRNGTPSSQVGVNQTFSSGSTLQVAMDPANNRAWVGYNNVWVNGTNGTDGNPSAGTNPTLTSLPNDLVMYVYMYSQTANSLNCGQRAFTYTPPTGFNALCTANMTIPTILKGANHFNVVTYTGTGSSLTPSAGFAFQPNLTWIKGRSGATDHAIYDAVRGVQKQIESNTTTDETTESTGLTAWTSSSFTVGTLAQVNTNAATYVAWNWKANGAGASNSVGTITATVSANTTAGVSIATYTGTGANATVGHGLGVAPSMVIVKARTTASTDQGWAVYHSSLTSAAYYILLSSNGAQTSDATVWNSTAPTSTVFSIGTNALTNTNADTYVAYCFASITGFSAIGSYIGNGSSDGPFVYLGFRPRYVMIKNTAATGDWRLQDAVRNPYNVMTYRLWASTSAAEDSSNLIDFLANGFKIRADSSSGETNSSGVTYIYIAFAEIPFNFANAR